LKMDIAAAYPKEAGINYWNRTVKLNRQTENVEISDDFSITNPKSLQQIFMTVCDVDTSEAGKVKLNTLSGKTAILNYDAKLWTISVEKPSTDGAEYSSFKTKWDGKEIKRIVLTAKTPNTKGIFNYSIRMEPK
jgi:glycine cleavage system protein P-like pyridoxal-binding family